MRNITQDTITQAVIARHTEASDGRLRELMTCLVQHLHAFARESRLTESEWLEGMRFLAETGQRCSDERQEFMLLSDALGLSMLVTALNQRRPVGCTETGFIGPVRWPAASAAAPGRSLEACFVRGHVRSLDGRPVAGAEVQLIVDGAGPVDDSEEASTPLLSRADGGFQFKTPLAEPRAIPHDGPVGRMLAALGRHPWRPAHLHFRVSAPGHETLVTHVFRQDGRYLDSDALFGVRPSLVADWVWHPAGRTPDGGHSDLPFHTLDFDFVLNPLATR